MAWPSWRLSPAPCHPLRKGKTVTAEPLPESAYVAQGYTVPQRREPGVVMSEREYDRLIERLDGCKQTGWADLWLAGVGAGAALAVGALTGALTFASGLPSGSKDVLWALTATGAVVLILCLVAYISQRSEHGKEVDELKKDLEMHRDRARAA